MQQISLSKLIFKQYARSALLVILTIEALLLLVYFLSNAAIIEFAKDEVRKQTSNMLDYAVTAATKELQDTVRLVEARTELFASAHALLFASPDSVALKGEQPVFGIAPNGTRYQANMTNGSSLFVARKGDWGKREQRFATNSVSLNPLYRRMVEPPVVASYINTPGDMNRLYPFIPNVWEQYPEDLHMEDFNFYFLADKKHNPARKPVWTEIYNDPAGNGVMLSCVAPVYVGDTLEGVVGLDINATEFAKAFSPSPLQGDKTQAQQVWRPSVLLVGQSPEQKGQPEGTVFAVPPPLEALLGRKEELEKRVKVTDESLGNSQLEERAVGNVSDIGARQAMEAFLQDPSRQEVQTIDTADGRYFFAGRSLGDLSGSQEWTWFVFAFKREADVLGPVHELAGRAQILGLFILAGMALFYLWFFRFLRRRAQRMAAMIADPVRSELRSKEAELAYTQGLYESASGYLHNVGNAITRMESSLMDLDKVIKSSEQYPEAFQRIKAGGAAGSETLKRFEEVLVGKTVPALKAVADSIGRIKDAIRNAISHQQAGFKAAVRQAAEDVDLSEILADMCELFRKEHPALTFKVDPDVRVRSHRDPLIQGIDNVIRNAIQASPPGGRIRVTCEGAKDGALIVVTDEGRGISTADLAKVTRAGFTTKEGGHGLGLHSFAVFLSATGGQLRVESEGPGKGATVSVDLRNA
jgi:signal transduction histidine kinase